MNDATNWLAGQRKNDLRVFSGSAWVVQHPEWTAYTPTITANTGAFTTVSAAGRYIRVGSALHINVVITVTTNGTAAGFVILPLPTGITSQSAALIPGRENGVSRTMLQGVIGASGTNFNIFDYANNYPAANGASLIMTGVIEVI